MKKIFTLIAAAAMLAVSCQKETPATDNTGSSSTPGKLTATIVKASTKVTYSETPELNLQPAWEVGDEIIGFDEAGSTYTLTVESVEAETATLSGTVPDGALHLIYKSGAKASDIGDKSLVIDYKNQAGDKTMPAVMLADGTVENGSCNFAFTNAGAIIGISAVNGVPSGATISKITVEGENLSAATVALSGSALALTATPAASDAISTAALSGITTTDANGTLSTPLYIAVPAGAVIKKVSASVSDKTYSYVLAAVKTAVAGNYLYVNAQEFTDPYNGHEYVEITAMYDGTNVTALKWATCNVGAASPKDYGYYFFWGGTVGYVHDGSKWVTEDGGVELSGGFNWSNTPFNNGSSSYDATYFSSVRNTVCPGTILAPDYDAASVNWGGTWRMPTSAEFKAMKDATYWAWDATDKGYYVFEADATHAAGTRASSIPGDLSKASALLFFPAAGVGIDARLYDAGNGYNASIYNAGSIGYYWSSSLDSSYPEYAYSLLFYSDYVFPQSDDHRYFGRSVRPVSD